ncbi:MAG: ATP synthase F1 subunit epsilon [Planctomycetaceae bacterium]|nr:ATP synthase F1 subunit epsilon [Planctomycetaceae bacterium]
MLQCIVVTPEQTLFDQPADFVALTLYDGELGVEPGHAPMIGRLGYGELRVRRDGRVDRYYVEGGFVEVLNNVVSVLTPRAVPADQLDQAVLFEQIASVKMRGGTTPEATAVRQRTLDQARAQLRVAQHAHDRASR